MRASDFFNDIEKSEIVEAIKTAEKDTSGEIRVHLELSCKTDVLDRASFIFAKLKMHKTEQRNGVLFYLAIHDKKFAVIGDAGINKVVDDGFWDSVKDLLTKHFATNAFAEGLVRGIIQSGEILKTHFPFLNGDINELPDDISYGDN